MCAGPRPRSDGVRLPTVFSELWIRLPEPGGDLLGPGQEPVPHAPVQQPGHALHGGALQRSALPQTAA